MDTLKLYIRLVSFSIYSQMQYRASFILTAIAYFLAIGIEIVTLFFLFERFHSIGSWNLEEVALLYGIVNIAFSLSEALGCGFDKFSTMVKSGDFDRVLLRPRSTLLQVAGNRLDLMRFGRLIQGVFVSTWALHALDLHLSLWALFHMSFATLGATLLFTGVFVFQATLCFWTTESLEVVHTVSHGSLEIGRYPLFVFEKWLQGFFVFIVPLACVSYYPVLTILGHHDGNALPLPLWAGTLTPIAGILFFLLACYFWRCGVLRYCSTGS